MLEGILSLNKDVPNVSNSSLVTGKLKKGVPGFNELGLPVEVNISTIMNRMMEVICMKEAQWQPGQNISSQISGLQPNSFNHLLVHAKQLAF